MTSTRIWFLLALAMTSACGSRHFADSGDDDDGSRGGAGGEVTSGTGGRDGGAGGTSTTGGVDGAGGSEGNEGGAGGSPSGVKISTATIGGEDLLGETAVGIDEDALIVLSFSEPMDKDATRAAYGSTSAPLLPDQVEFSWNSAGTILSIRPRAPLPYKTATPETVADTLSFTISTAARSQAGVELAEEFVASFRPWRRVTHVLAATSGLTGSFHHWCPSPTSYVLSNSIRVAWDYGCHMGPPLPHGETHEGKSHGFVHFALGVLPERVRIETATLAFTSAEGGHWPGIGEAKVQEVDYGVALLSTRSTSAPGSPFDGDTTGVLADLTPNLVSTVVSRSYNVKTRVEAVLSERETDTALDYLQYRLAPTNTYAATTGSVSFMTSLTLVYLAP